MHASGFASVHGRNNPGAKTVAMQKSMIHVPDQKLGSGRTRILMSHDNMQLLQVLDHKKQIDNYLQESVRNSIESPPIVRP